jgi:hypothetical protein
MSKLLAATLTATVAALAGCADTPESDADYGRSVQQMVHSQTYDPAAAANPPENAPDAGDAARLKNALDAYRKDVAKGNDEVKAPIVFEVGNDR